MPRQPKPFFRKQTRSWYGSISEQKLAAIALEEVELQDISFDEAYRACVAHLANRWTP